MASRDGKAFCLARWNENLIRFAHRSSGGFVKTHVRCRKRLNRITDNWFHSASCVSILGNGHLGILFVVRLQSHVCFKPQDHLRESMCRLVISWLFAAPPGHRTIADIASRALQNRTDYSANARLHCSGGPSVAVKASAPQAAQWYLRNVPLSPVRSARQRQFRVPARRRATIATMTKAMTRPIMICMAQRNFSPNFA